MNRASLMKMTFCLLLAFVFISGSGCAYLNTYRESLDIEDGDGVTMDIKQRAILVSKDPETNRTLVCAEPSPEALSAYAAQLAGEAYIPESVTAKLVAAFGEGSSYVGMRTQSIQLLRDTSFRLCEAHMNGALNAGEYNILLRRYQKYTVALLAIEQLTGTLRVPPMGIGTTGSAEAGRSLSEMMAETEKIDGLINEKNEELKKLKESLAETGNTDEQKKEINQKIKKVEGYITDFKENKKQIGEGIKNARGLAAGGSATVYVSPIGTPFKPSDKQIEKVTEAIHAIVQKIIDTDDTGQICMAFMGNCAKAEQAKVKVELTRAEAYRFQTEALKIRADISMAESKLKKGNPMLKASAAENQVKAEEAYAQADIDQARANQIKTDNQESICQKMANTCGAYFTAHNNLLTQKGAILSAIATKISQCKDPKCVSGYVQAILKLAANDSFLSIGGGTKNLSPETGTVKE